MENETEQTEQKPKEKGLVDRAAELAERIEQENQRSLQAIEKLEKLRSEQILGGKTSAGNADEKPKPETPQEYAKRVLLGRK